MNQFSVTLIFLALMSMTGTLFAQSPMDPAQANVQFPGPGGVTLKGYLSVPSGNGPFPAVVMVHEWWGLNRDIAALADALAAEGYVVLAADTFRGSVAKTPQDAMKQIQTTPAAQIGGDLDAALDYLRSNPKVNADRVASIGFCFGGTQSMYMGTRNPELAAVVIFYGSGPITEADRLGSMREAGPVLGIYGQDDTNIPVDKVKAFEQAMKNRGVENTVTVYPGVGHAFVKSSNYNKGGTPQQAWQQMVQFLAKNLKG